MSTIYSTERVEPMKIGKMELKQPEDWMVRLPKECALCCPIKL